MKLNHRYTLSAIILISFSFSASAQWKAGVSVGKLDLYETNVITLQGGYSFDFESVSIEPAVRIGTGLNSTRPFDFVEDDVISGTEFDLEYIAAIDTRITYKLTENIGLFIQPSLYKYKWKGSTNSSDNGNSASVSDTDFAVGVGGNYRINQNWEATILYESFQLDDHLAVGLSYSF